MGHPLVSLKKIDKETISISQRHFLIDSSNKPVESGFKYVLHNNQGLRSNHAGFLVRLSNTVYSCKLEFL
jgi:hypothetical protein